MENSSDSDIILKTSLTLTVEPSFDSSVTAASNRSIYFQESSQLILFYLLFPGHSLNASSCLLQMSVFLPCLVAYGEIGSIA